MNDVQINQNEIQPANHALYLCDFVFYPAIFKRNCCRSNVYFLLNSFCRTGLKKINLMKGNINHTFELKF